MTLFTPDPYEGQPASYEDYLASEHWLRTRALALTHQPWCQLCGTRRRRLEVHHNNYAHLGAERWADLIVLCWVCHHQFHAPGRHPGDKRSGRRPRDNRPPPPYAA